MFLSLLLYSTIYSIYLYHPYIGSTNMLSDETSYIFLEPYFLDLLANYFRSLHVYDQRETRDGYGAPRRDGHGKVDGRRFAVSVKRAPHEFPLLREKTPCFCTFTNSGYLTYKMGVPCQYNVLAFHVYTNCQHPTSWCRHTIIQHTGFPASASIILMTDTQHCTVQKLG